MFNNDGIQIWTVPKTGKYLIQAVGASSYPVGFKDYGFGFGADIQTTVNLRIGHKIKILVGQHGEYNSRGGNWTISGGGGGSFVVNEDDEPIIIAGGGGGSCSLQANTLMVADNNTSAHISNNGLKPMDSLDIKPIYKSGNGGESGYGGKASNFAGGGGGFYNNGENCVGTGNATGGFSFKKGGEGGTSGDSTFKCDGGFGGGGGGSAGSTGNGDYWKTVIENGVYKSFFDGAPPNFKYNSGGGGGGYSGGGGGGVIIYYTVAVGWWGGGGGSFSKTPMIYNDYNYMGNGKVVITFLES